MKEHGILFTAPMVRALLAGTKTQTRRIVKGQSAVPGGTRFEIGRSGAATFWTATDAAVEMRRESVLMAPHGPVGRRLWVRETWNPGYGRESGLDCGWSVMLAADRAVVPGRDWNTAGIRGPFYNHDMARKGDDVGIKWKPAIHMPRWASRITLEVTRVRLERVQSITEEDARAEGVTAEADPEDLVYEGDGGADIGGGHGYTSPRSFVAAYERLWNEINGVGSWASNPWVWVYSFRRVE